MMDAVLPTYSAVVESKTLVRFVQNLLSTYVGHEPSQLILEGQVRRGDVRTITAAIMLMDLRDFTMLTNILSPRAVIRLLNEYFDRVFPPIREQGGEVLEIMGDGVLAIFRHEARDGGRAACRAALEAARRALGALAERNRMLPDGGAVLQAGAALHYGTVSYGNIGAGDRLDFTVIGADVNLTSRIEHFNRELGRTLIMSQAFAEQLDCPVWEIGHYELRGFTKRQPLFELPPDNCSRLRSASGGKEAAQQIAGFALADAAIDFRQVMASRLVENARTVLDAAALRIVGAEIKPADARQGDRCGAHRAGFERHVQIAAGQSLEPEPGGAVAQHQHLGMRGRIAVAFDPVPGGRDDDAGGIEQHRADRHLPLRRRCFRLGESQGHCAGNFAGPARPAYLRVAHAVRAPDFSDNAKDPRKICRLHRRWSAGTHCKSDRARRAVLAARRRALDRRGAGLASTARS